MKQGLINLMASQFNARFKEVVLSAANASEIKSEEELQILWSGYGRIWRIHLDGSAEHSSVVVKHVAPPTSGQHPRGWNTDRSHQRKLKSYQVETEWYRNWSEHCAEACRVPQCLAIEENGDELLMVMEDLDAAGFPLRLAQVKEAEMKACLTWLAHFHATFMGERAEGLWEVGTYWHFDTRPDEWNALEEGDLKDAAKWMDETLQQVRFQSLVHGDAKLANFCFSQTSSQVAAVDFQYVGGGCGMKDVSYFIGSCLNEEACEAQEESLLNTYFSALGEALSVYHPAIDAAAIEKEWREMFPVAWADFHRFLKGWSPGHWKINGYSERMTREVLGMKGE